MLFSCIYICEKQRYNNNRNISDIGKQNKLTLFLQSDDTHDRFDFSCDRTATRTLHTF